MQANHVFSDLETDRIFLFQAIGARRRELNGTSDRLALLYRKYLMEGVIEPI